MNDFTINNRRTRKTKFNNPSKPLIQQTNNQIIIDDVKFKPKIIYNELFDGNYNYSINLHISIDVITLFKLNLITLSA